MVTSPRSSFHGYFSQFAEHSTKMEVKNFEHFGVKSPVEKSREVMDFPLLGGCIYTYKSAYD